MPSIRVDVSGDHEQVGRRMGLNVFPILHTTEDWTIDAMEHGMVSGATSLMVLIPGDIQGQRVIVAAETSLQCFMQAATILRAKFEDELDVAGWAVLSPAARAALAPRFAESIQRCVPSATADQALEAAHMMLDAVGADAPPDARPPV